MVYPLYKKRLFIDHARGLSLAKEGVRHADGQEGLLGEPRNTPPKTGFVPLEDFLDDNPNPEERLLIMERAKLAKRAELRGKPCPEGVSDEDTELLADELLLKRQRVARANFSEKPRLQRFPKKPRCRKGFPTLRRTPERAFSEFEL
ncbi:MAG: hypothetical protein AAB495_04530 [Patescibacteria group bacterium]